MEATLDNLIASFSELSLAPAIGIELEFYIDKSALIDPMYNACAERSQLFIGIEKERGEKQYEVQLNYSTNLLQLIKEIYIVKSTLCEIAGQHTSQVDFSAKPCIDGPGSALHVHLSLHNKINVDVVAEKKYLLQAIAGLCEMMPHSMLDFAPHVTCYQRFQHPDINTPTTVSWGYNNRTAAIRVLNNNRLEHRVPCADSLPEVVITKILAGALHGILQKRTPMEPVYGVASCRNYHLMPLPLTCTEAKRCCNKY